MDKWQRIAERAEAKADDLSQQLLEMESKMKTLIREFRTVSSVGCDGAVLIPICKYNRIIAVLNSTIKNET